MSQTKQKPKSCLPSHFDWTAHYTKIGNPYKAFCGKKLLGIDAEGEPLCKECVRIRDENWFRRG